MISRNSIWRLLGSFLAIFFVSGAHAQVDYYSACDTIKGVEIVYIVTHDEYGGVYFENAKNSLMNEPIVWTDTGVRAIPETMPFAERDNKIVNEIIHKVFTKKEIKQFRKSKNIAEVGVIIDPMTGKSMEVAYTLTNLKEFNDPLLHTTHPERLSFTPHIGWASKEALNRLVQGIAKNIKETLSD